MEQYGAKLDKKWNLIISPFPISSTIQFEHKEPRCIVISGNQEK